MHALLSDSDRFPFGREEVALPADAGMELIALEGHDPEAVVSAGREVSAILVYHAHLGVEEIEEPAACRVPARLLELENAVLTPHAAAYTDEALAEVRACAVADAIRVVVGERPLNPVPV